MSDIFAEASRLDNSGGGCRGILPPAVRSSAGAGLENRRGSADNSPSDHERADSDDDAETLARVLVAELAEIAEFWRSLDEPTRAEILRLAGVESERRR